MKKTVLGAKTFLYPMPIVLVGTKIAGRPNFETVAYCGMVQHHPAVVAFGSAKDHYTNAGIKKCKSFSINIPSAELVKITDYCGLVSGKTVSKSSLFSVSYGVLENAPMIDECPLCLECRLMTVLDFGGTSDIFLGEVVEAYADEACLTNGLPDIKKLNPIVFSMHDNRYWTVGESLGAAWSIGKSFQPAAQHEPRTAKKK